MAAEQAPPSLPEVIANLKQRGVKADQIASFLAEIGAQDMSTGMARVSALGESGTRINLPGGTILEGWQSEILLALLPTSVRLLILPTQLLCNRANVTVGIGPAVTAGLYMGAGLSCGVLIAPGNQIGIYGTMEGIAGNIASISATIQVTVIHGSPEKFRGAAIAAAASVDAGEGLTMGGSAIFTPSGDYLGFSGEVGVTIGEPAIEAMVKAQFTETTMSLRTAAGVPI